MGVWVVDASVALKWFLTDGEADAEQAMALLADVASGTASMVQPPHFVAEVAAVLARFKPQKARVDLRDLLEIEFEAVSSEAHYARALTLAIRYKHHLFDTLYHATALETAGAELVTADERYYTKARKEGRIRLLSSL